MIVSTGKPSGGFYRIKTLADLLDMSPRWVYARIESGDFHAYRRGRGIVICAASVADYLDRHRARTATPDG